MMAENSGDGELVSSSEHENALPSPRPQTPPASVLKQDAAQHAKKRQKIKAAELEEMHAVSQRLLRETPNACFKAQIASGKSITSVLEKIRLRKRQLEQGTRSAFSVLLPDCSDSLEVLKDDVSSIRSFESPAQNLSAVGEIVDKQESKVQKTFHVHVNNEEGANLIEVQAEEDEDIPDAVKPPGRHASGHQSDDAGKSEYLGSGNAFRAPMEDTQESLSWSDASDNEDDENLKLDQEEDEFLGSRVNLHLDTQTQDDDEEWLDEDANKENVEPGSLGRNLNREIFKGPSIKALIDDEAEDEDEDGLVPGEEDEGDEDEDMNDIVVEETNEKERDREKRADLHRKWLEQQDAVMTDDILLRLKTGWRPREGRKRGLEFIDDDLDLTTPKGEDGGEISDKDMDLQDDNELLSEDSQDVDALKDDVDQDEDRPLKSMEDLNDMHESSDDEEAEQKMIRERFLQESEEQTEFMSPADDETSREIFGLINKVNIASTNKKPKNGNVNDLRHFGGRTSNSNSSSSSKSSFLRRSVSASCGMVLRQASSAGSGTRSFIFGRDDSNSSHSSDQHAALRDNKENVEPTPQASIKNSSQSRHHKAGEEHSKASKLSATRLGPSLFEILRRQSTNLDLSMKVSASEEGIHPISPILTVFKSIKPANTSQGPRRM